MAPVVVETPGAATVEAIRFRNAYGLRADRAYVEAVAVDARADREAFGVPLLPQEVAGLEARSRDTHETISIIDAYRGSDGDFGGVYVDQARGGVVVALFTANLGEHEATIRAKLPPLASVEFRAARYTYSELRKLQDVVGRDDGWFRGIAASVERVGVDIENNAVEIRISSANPDASALIAAHYGLGDRLRIVSDGTGAALIPWGTVRGRVLTANGRPARGLHVILSDTSADPGSCGGGDVGFGVAQDGTFEYPCQAGQRTIRLLDQTANADPLPVIGEGTVVVVAGKTVELVIRLNR